MIGLLLQAHFLICHFFSILEANSFSNGHWGLSFTDFHSHLPYTHHLESMSSHTSWVCQNSVLVWCYRYYLLMEWQTTVHRHVIHLSSAHAHVPLSHRVPLQHVSSKMKLIGISRWQEPSISTPNPSF